MGRLQVIAQVSCSQWYNAVLSDLVQGVPRHELSYGRHGTLMDVVRNLQNLKPSTEFRDNWQ